MARKAGVWISTVYRFGYWLTVAERTKQAALNAMSEEYIKTYAKYNALDETSCRAALVSPELDDDGEADESSPYNEFARYYKDAMYAAEPRFYEYGVVDWG